MASDRERIKYYLAVMGFKAIYDENVPSQLKLKQKVAMPAFYEATIKEF